MIIIIIIPVAAEGHPWPPEKNHHHHHSLLKVTTLRVSPSPGIWSQSYLRRNLVSEENEGGTCQSTSTNASQLVKKEEKEWFCLTWRTSFFHSLLSKQSRSVWIKPANNQSWWRQRYAQKPGLCQDQQIQAGMEEWRATFCRLIIRWT